MSKRNKDIQNLISTIVNDPPQETATAEAPTKTDLTEEQVQAYGITPEMEQKLNEVRRAKVGRPKGTATGRPKNPNEGRATFVVDTDLIRRVKYISLMDGRLLKDVISEALTAYVTKWESETGQSIPNLKSKK